MVLAVCCAILGLGMASWAAEDRPMTPEGRLGLSCQLAGEESPDLGALAEKSYRPLWAPLPMFRGDTAPTPYLHKLLASADPASRARSAFLLGQIGSPDSIKLLVERLRDPDRAVRVQSGIALACMGDARGVPVCAAVLASEPSWIKYYAVYGLWCTNTPRAKEVLRRNANCRDELVGSAIRGALSTPHVPPPPVAPLSQSAEVSSKASPEEIWNEAADMFVREGDWWWHAGDFHQAIRCLEVILFLDPSDVESYGIIAWLQWSLGHDATAIRTLKRGIAAVPSSPDAHFALGLHYMNTKRYALAEEPLRKAVELGGDHLMRRQYAHCLEKLGRLEESLGQWTKVLEIHPDDAAARRNYERVKGLVDERAKE